MVHERRDDLYPGKDTRSVALDVSYEGKRWWVMLEWDDSGSTMARRAPDRRAGTHLSTLSWPPRLQAAG